MPTATLSDDETAIRVNETRISVVPTPPRVDLKTLDDVRLEMARVYRDMRTARIEAQDGTRLVYVLAQIGKIIATAEIEKRVEAIEHVLKARRLPR